MPSTRNLSLTDELRSFVDQQAGDGTMYATPVEFVRDLIRRQKLQMEAEQLRDGVIAGLHDAAQGRIQQFNGSVLKLMNKNGE